MEIFMCRSLLMLSAVTICCANAVLANHEIIVGPRMSYYSSEDKTYKRYSPGLSLGYRYNLNAANMFRISFGAQSSNDFQFGFNNDQDYSITGTNTFIEPGMGLLLTALIPFTMRFDAGFSYRLSNYYIEYPDTATSYYDKQNTANYFGLCLSPGLFLQNDIGRAGFFMKNRFFAGNLSSRTEGSHAAKTDLSAKSWEWGIEGGINTGRISHEITLSFSRVQSSSRENSVWSSWKDLQSEKSISYRLCINIPGVQKLPRLNLSNNEITQKNSSIQADSTPQNQQKPLNLRGDIFRPKCESECFSSGKDSSECSKLIADAWYNTVNTKSRYMVTPNEQNKMLYEMALTALKLLCPNACGE
jgi:hypothetical protein